MGLFDLFRGPVVIINGVVGDGHLPTDAELAALVADGRVIPIRFGPMHRVQWRYPSQITPYDEIAWDVIAVVGWDLDQVLRLCGRTPGQWQAVPEPCTAEEIEAMARRMFAGIDWPALGAAVGRSAATQLVIRRTVETTDWRGLERARRAATEADWDLATARLWELADERIEADRAAVLGADIESLAAAILARIDPGSVPPAGTDARPLVVEAVLGLDTAPEWRRLAALPDPAPAFDRLYAMVKEGVDAVRRRKAERDATERARIEQRGVNDLAAVVSAIMARIDWQEMVRRDETEWMTLMHDAMSGLDPGMPEWQRTRGNWVCGRFDGDCGTGSPLMNELGPTIVTERMRYRAAAAAAAWQRTGGKTWTWTPPERR